MIKVEVQRTWSTRSSLDDWRWNQLRGKEAVDGSEDDREVMSKHLEGLEHLEDWKGNRLWEEEMAYGSEDDL